MSPGEPKRGVLRVKNVRPIITVEGDLVVAGTHGTLLGWVTTPENEALMQRGDPRALVQVAWDSYMYLGDEVDNPKDAHTLSGRSRFHWHTEVENLQHV